MRRTRTANYLAQEVEFALRRIQTNAHALDGKARQQCNFCGVGKYRITTADMNKNGARVLESFGLGAHGGTLWLFLVCDFCGNVQYFRLDGTPALENWRNLPE